MRESDRTFYFFATQPMGAMGEFEIFELVTSYLFSIDFMCCSRLRSELGLNPNFSSILAFS